MRILRPVTPTPEQLQLMGHVTPGFRIIRGAAGSGKTTTSLMRLRELTRVRLDRRRRYDHTDPVRVLVLTFNRTLRGYITELVNQCLPWYTREELELDISTFGRWSMRLLGRPDVLDGNGTEAILKRQLRKISTDRLGFFLDEVEYILGRFEPENHAAYLTARRGGRGTTPRVARQLRTTLIEEVIPAYTRAKKKRGVIDWNDVAVRAATVPRQEYDVVIVDEAQDLSANQVRAVLKHLHRDHTTTFVLDSVQRIYPQYFAWSEVGIRIHASMVHTLRENYRNTTAITDLARPLVEGLPQERDGVVPDPDACLRSGIRPILVAGTYSAQLRYMLSQVSPSSTECVALLQPRGGGWFDYARKEFSARGIPFTELTRRSQWPTGSEAVALSTIHSAKGLEFDHVLLPGLSQQVTPHGPDAGDADLDRLRRLLAMGIGRARKSVMIGYKPGEESTLISLLQRSTYDLVRV